MSDQRIDKVFRNKLSDSTMPVPEDMWKNIEKQLPASRKRLPWGPLGILAGSVIAISALIAWSTMAKPIQPESASLAINVPASSAEDLNTSVSKTSLNSEAHQAKVSTELNTAGNDASSAIAKSTVVASSSTSTSSSTSSSSSSSLNQSRTVKSHSTSGNKLLVSGNQNKVKGHVAHGTLDEETYAVSSKINMDQQVTEQVEESTNTISVPVSSAVRNKLTEVTLLNGGTTLLHINPRKLPDPAKDCYRFGKKNSGGGGVIFAEVYGGPMTSMKSMESRDEDVSDYITARDTSEDMRLSWNAGVRLGYWHHSGLTVRTGAHYSVVNERFAITDGSFIKWITEIDTIYDGSGNIVKTDTIRTPVSGTRIKKSHNRYHSVDIPLLVGFQLSHERWTYGVQAGPMFNVVTSRKGEIFNTSIEPDTISSDYVNEYPAFKDKLGVSLYASLHLGYRIGSRMWVYAEPYYHRRLKSITLESYPIDQRQSNIGLSVGLRVNLR